MVDSAMSGLGDSWESKIVGFHVFLTELRENDKLVKYIIRFHYVMVLWTVMYICLETFGIYVKLASGQFTLIEVLVPIQYHFFLCTMLVGISSLIFKRHLIAAYIRDIAGLLRCSSWKDEAHMWQKHLKTMRVFLVIFMVVHYVCGPLPIVLSPVARIGSKISSWYVVFPVWYPVDVLASSGCYWAAYVSEAVMLQYCNFCYGSFNILFLYTTMTAIVRFDVLGEFLKKMTVPPIQAGLRNGQLVEAESRIGSDSGSKCLSANTHETTDVTFQKLKDSLNDLNILQRQKIFVNRAFSSYITAVHAVTFIANVILPFAVISEVQNAGKVNTNAFMLSAHSISCFWAPFFISYLTSKLQEAHDNLLHLLWECEWFKEDKEFKNLFRLSQGAMKQSSILKAYSFYPINLYNFATCLLDSWSYFLFLHNFSARK